MTFKYEGELSTPIPLPPYRLWKSEANRKEIVESIVELQHRKMSLLFDVHGIQRGNWQSLCFALAESHVPGLRVVRKKRTGPVTKWDFFTRAELFIAVERTGIQNITEATKILAELEPWRSLVIRVRGAETLRDEYFRVDKGFIESWRKLHAIAANGAK